jgi:hypothetical protein
MPEIDPDAVVGLSDALVALRRELVSAWTEGEGPGRRLRFRIPEPIELTFQVAVTKAGKGEAGIKWGLVALGGEASRGTAVTQTLSLKLDLLMYDEQGNPVDQDKVEISGRR